MVCVWTFNPFLWLSNCISHFILVPLDTRSPQLPWFMFLFSEIFVQHNFLIFFCKIHEFLQNFAFNLFTRAFPTWSSVMKTRVLFLSTVFSFSRPFLLNKKLFEFQQRDRDMVSQLSCPGMWKTNKPFSICNTTYFDVLIACHVISPYSKLRRLPIASFQCVQKARGGGSDMRRLVLQPNDRA